MIKGEEEDNGDDKEDEDDLNQMFKSERAGESVKLWRDVLAQSVIHVKPGTLHLGKAAQKMSLLVDKVLPQ